jgi:hypothetical protein
VEVVAVEVVRDDAQEEAVEERGQVVVVGHLVGGAEQRDERHRGDVGAVGEAPLVQDAEERVQDGRVGLEDLVEEDDLGLGQHALGAARVAALAKLLDIDGPKSSLGSVKRVRRYSK